MPTPSARRPRLAVAAIGVAALVALSAASWGQAAPSTPAAGFTLRISTPPTVSVGRPAIIRVTGTIPLRYLKFLYWVKVVSMRTAVMSSCPAESWDAAQIAQATGGSILVLSSRAVPDGSGRFTIPVGIRPYAPGRARICAYTYAEATTLARAARIVTVKRARG
jgi:hypothetical protein